MGGHDGPKYADQLAEEFAAAKEAWEQVEHARGAFQGEREAAARQLELAESIREAIQNELLVARAEQGETLARAERMSSALGESQREALESKKQIQELGRKNDALSVRLERQTSSLTKLREGLTLSRDKEAAATRDVQSATARLSRTLTERDGFSLRLESQRASTAHLAQKFAALSESHHAAANELKRAQARLARDREAISMQKKELRALKSRCAELAQRETRLARDLMFMSKARDRALAAAKSAQASADQSRLMLERFMRGNLVTRRAAARPDAAA